MKKKSIAIVWESQTGGGVNSYLKYLLNTRSFIDTKITIFTNTDNKGAKQLIKDLKILKNIKFVFFNSFFSKKRSYIKRIIFYFLKPFLLMLTVFRFKKI